MLNIAKRDISSSIKVFTAFSALEVERFVILPVTFVLIIELFISIILLNYNN